MENTISSLLQNRVKPFSFQFLHQRGLPFLRFFSKPQGNKICCVPFFKTTGERRFLSFLTQKKTKQFLVFLLLQRNKNVLYPQL